MKVNLNSILIGVRNIEKAKSFYEKVFGVTFEEVRPPFSCFTLNGIEFDIEEDSSERSEGWSQKYLGTIKPISFKVDNVDDFLKLIVENKGKVLQYPTDKPWGWREASFTDIDGNSFMVEQEL